MAAVGMVCSIPFAVGAYFNVILDNLALAAGLALTALFFIVAPPPLWPSSWNQSGTSRRTPQIRQSRRPELPDDKRQEQSRHYDIISLSLATIGTAALATLLLATDFPDLLNPGEPNMRQSQPVRKRPLKQESEERTE